MRVVNKGWKKGWKRERERGVAGISIGGDTFITRPIKSPDNQKLVKMIYNLPPHLIREFFFSPFSFLHPRFSQKELY